MNKEFIRMQKLAGLLTEGLYTSDEKAPMEGMSTSKMTKKELKAKIKEMMTPMPDEDTDETDEYYATDHHEDYSDGYIDDFDHEFDLGIDEDTIGQEAAAEMGSMDEASLGSFPTDIDWEVVGRDMDGLSLEGYSETTNKYYAGAIGGSYNPDTDPNPEFSNEDLLFIEEIPFKHLSPIQKHLLRKGNMDEDLFEAKKDKESDTEDVIVADTDEEVPAEGGEDVDVDTTDGNTQVDVNMDGIPDVDTGSAESKKAFTSLVDTYNSAKELGDPKLTQMIANALTYYNKNIILKSGQPQA